MITREKMPGAALKVSTVLSLTALTIAVLQGVIGLESSRPARLSMRKTNILLVLQVLMLPVIIAAEAVTFAEARDGLKNALTHLNWTPYALFVLGIIAYIQDTMYTLYTVCSSRIYWIPLCATRRSKDRWYEALPLIIASVFVSILVCWRQKWGFNETIVDQGGKTRTLAGALIGASAIIAVVGAFANTILAVAMLKKNSTGNVFNDLRNLRNPSQNRVYAASFQLSGARDRDGHDEIDEQRTRNQLEHLVELQRGTKGLNELRRTNYDAWLHSTPLHVRNLMVGEDQFLILRSRAPFRMSEQSGCGWDIFEVISLVQIVSILPLLILVVMAMFRLHTYFSEELFKAFKELVDIVLVYSSLNISFGLKRLLWSFSGCYEKEMNGKLELDPNMRYERSDHRNCVSVTSADGLSNY